MKEVRDKMEKVLEVLREELIGIKTGRADPSLVEKVLVEAYETKMPLVELATISTFGPNELAVVPFDQTIIKNIERSLALDRNLGISPVVDGNVVRIKIPPLNEERRRQLVKVLGQKLEAGRIMIRQARRDKMVGIKQAFENKELNEDEKFRQEKDLQKVTDEFNQKIEEIGKQKEEELLSI